jgi:hypothetical protein
MTFDMRRAGARLTALLLVATLGACNTDELLEVDTPDQITPDKVNSPSGALALRSGAIRDFYSFFNSNVENAVLVGGMLGDELINARNGFDHLDLRKYDENQSPNAFTNFSNARTNIIRAREALIEFTADGATRQSQLGGLHAMQGLLLTAAAELYCNGVPFSNLDENREFVFDPKLYTNTELWTLALSQFDSALAILPAADALRNLARIGKARALLDLGRPADAATVVRAGGGGTGSAAVATSYVFNVEHSATGLANGANAWIPASANMGVPPFREGGNGLNYPADPRVGSRFFRNGQDGTTPVWVPLIAWIQTSASPVPVATGTEARLIEAEAQFAAGDAGWINTLNALRSASAVAAQLPALTDPGTAAGRQDLIMTERAMWLYLTGHRVGDLRRLIRQYGRTESQVFPSGAYFKGGTYGIDVNIPPPFGERNNPAFTGCIDRKA